MNQSNFANFTNYSQVPWYRKSATHSTLLILHLLTLGGLPFMLFTCVALATGDVYFNQRTSNGELRKWSLANKVFAFIILGISFLVIWLVGFSFFSSADSNHSTEQSQSLSEVKTSANDKNPKDKKYTVVDRKTFSLTLPSGWVEDTADDDYDPNSYVIFENSSSCVLILIVGDKSTGLRVQDLLDGQMDYYKRKMTDRTTKPIAKYATYDVKGFEIDGKINGFAKYNVKLIGLDNGKNVGLLVAGVDPTDQKLFAKDFQSIENSFRFK